MIDKPELIKTVDHNSVKTNQQLKVKIQNRFQTRYNFKVDNKRENYQPKIDELISLRQAADISGYTTNHLRLLISKGKLWAKKIDSFWVTTEISIQDYMDSKSNFGRPKKNP